MKEHVLSTWAGLAVGCGLAVLGGCNSGSSGNEAARAAEQSAELKPATAGVQLKSAGNVTMKPTSPGVQLRQPRALPAVPTPSSPRAVPTPPKLPTLLAVPAPRTPSAAPAAPIAPPAAPKAPPAAPNTAGK